MSLLSDEIYVDVISNASMNIYEDNTLSKFTNKLNHPLILEGDWEVGIKEVFYPIQFKAIRRKVKIAIFAVPEQVFTTEFHYNDSDEIRILLNGLNESIASICPKSWTAPYFEEHEESVTEKDKDKDTEKRIRIVGGSDGKYKVYPQIYELNLVKTLGFDSNTFFNQLRNAVKNQLKYVHAKSRPEIGIKSHLLFIYTDIIREHFVGDATSRLLRVVPLSKGNFEKLGHVSFPQPIYYPVRSCKIETINIIMCDESGSQVKFKSGRTFISLHFRKLYKKNKD